MTRIDPEAIHKILTILTEDNNGRTKHRLLREAGSKISCSSQLDKYLIFCLERSLIREETKEKRLYFITELGRVCLQYSPILLI